MSNGQPMIELHRLHRFFGATRAVYDVSFCVHAGEVFGFATGMLTSVLLQIAMLVASAAVPFFIQTWMSGFSRPEYSVFQCVNWFWTLGESLDEVLRTLSGGTPWGGSTPAIFATVVLVWGAAIVLFLVNLALAGRDIDMVRVGTPERVLEDNQIVWPEREKQTPV